MNAPAAHIYEFGDFRLDAGRRLLWQQDAPVQLPPRVFETLLYMLEHHDTVLDKERLMEAIWPDSIVEENNLTQHISTLRRVFGETPGSHRFIVTVPGRGYRFVANVRLREDVESPKIPESRIELAKTERIGSVSPPGQPVTRRSGMLLLLATAAVLVLSVAALVFWRGRMTNPPDSPVKIPADEIVIPEKSIAVLPFENLSADAENAFLAFGIQEEILSNLARISDLKVTSRTSANLYKSRNPRNSREIGQQLGVAHLLEGSVQRAGNHLRVNAQLVDTRTDAHLWAQTYDRDVADIFAIQTEIAKTIADQLRAKISPAEQAAMTQAPTADLVANALYVQALQLDPGPSLPQSLFDAVRLLEEAVTRDPRFVRAYCQLSKTHLVLYFGGHDHTPARREMANGAIEKAAQIQPNAGEVHLARSQYFYLGFLDYDHARAELDLARRTLPNDAAVYFQTAVIDRRQGRFTEAMRNFEHAVELDPRNMDFLMTASTTYNSLHRYSEAKRLHERLASVSPHDYWARLERASLALDERADIQPLRHELDAIRAEQPGAAPAISAVLFDCAISERDSVAAGRALDIMPPEGPETSTNFVFPREWFVGLAARTFGDSDGARVAFTAARTIAEKIVRDQPDYAPGWSLLGRIDAALGRKEDAIKEGRHACELLPISKDAWAGPYYVKDLASIYAWTGESDLALDQLELLAAKGLHYGELKLSPEWDPLRSNPRFEKLIALHAPKTGEHRQ
jgi:TolB-like protein/DNA-binding winged helix-turn-helix (wHTH) protein/Tfp pilus assembly protein PilF